MGPRMTPSIASVTIAYNAVSVLERQISALLGQTRPLEELIVVDNASTDGTVAWLSEHYPQVIVLRMLENTGTGGALAAGIEYALQRGHTWIWTFDGDSIPNEDALQTLLHAWEGLGTANSDIGILATVPFHPETGTQYPPLLWRDGFVKPSAEILRQPLWFADLVISSGCMVRRGVVERVGLPRADFFIDFVDFEYCLRIRSCGYKIAVVTNAKLAHEIGKAKKMWLHGSDRFWPDQVPLREYYMSRNLIYTAWWLYPSPAVKRFVVRHLARHAGGVLLYSSRKLACLARMAQGICDGSRGKLGIRFRPNELNSCRAGIVNASRAHEERV